MMQTHIKTIFYRKGHAMGLPERRKVSEFQQGSFVTYQSKINEIVGKDVMVEVNWDQIVLEGYEPEKYDEFWPQVYFEPLLKALENICFDDLGKNALAQNLDKIVIKNEAGHTSEVNWCSFSDKVITLDHKSDSNIAHADARAEALQKLLEESL